MPKQIRTFEEFKNELESNLELQNQFKNDPVAAADQFQQQSPLATDKWIYRIIVLSLGITILSIIIGVMILIGIGKFTQDFEVPSILTAIGSAAIGALAGLLAPAPKSN